MTQTPLLVPGAVSMFRNTALRVESGVRRVALDRHPTPSTRSSPTRRPLHAFTLTGSNTMQAREGWSELFLSKS